MQNSDLNLAPSIGLLWFVLGLGATLLAGAGIWIVCLTTKAHRQKKQLCGLMYDKGVLTMRVSILEDALKEKERK